MVGKIIFVFLLFSLSFESPPTPCVVCKNYIQEFYLLEPKKQVELIDKECFKSHYSVSKDIGVCEWIDEEGVDLVLEKLRQCKEISCIREVCSKTVYDECYDLIRPDPIYKHLLN